MKKLTRVLSVVMAIAMLFTMSMSASAATYTDVKAEDSYYEAVEALSALGVVKGYTEGDFQPEGKITRAEAAAIIMRIMGMAAVENTRINTQFTDVTSEHWASGVIAAAADSAIVNGMGDGTFAPSAEVTYDQVVKMLVCAMGYQKKAEASVAAGTNVFPTGYNIVANQKRITEGTAKTEGGATRGTVARLVYNALTVNLMDQTSFGTDVEFKEIEKASILWTKLNAIQIETKIASIPLDPTQNKITIIPTKYDDVTVKNGYTLPGSVKKGDVDLAGLQGLTVKALVDITDKADPVLLAVFPQSSKNAELVVDPQLFEDFAEIKLADGTGTGNYNPNIRYYKSADDSTPNTSSKIEAPFVAYMNMNTVYTSAAAATDSDVAIGLNALIGSDAVNKVTTNNKAYRFVDTDNNGKYDTLFIDSAASFVVGKIVDKEIYRDNSSSIFNSSLLFDGNKAYNFAPLDLDTEDEKVSYSIKDAEGKELAFEDIKVGDILTVAQSYESDIWYYDITVSSASAVEGTITTVSAEKVKGTTNTTIDYYEIDGKAYRVNGAANASKLEAGTAGTFYITADGSIISYELQASAKAYGIVVATGAKSGTFSNGVQAQIMTKEGTLKTLDFATNVGFYTTATEVTNGVTDVASNVDADTSTAGFQPNAAFNIAAGTIVIYETNSSDEIRRIYTTQAAIEAKDEDVKFETLSSDAYDADSAKLKSKYVTEESVIIGIPSTASVGDKDKYSVASIDALADAETYNGTLVYDAASREVTFAFITNMLVKPAYNTVPFVVTGKSTTSVDGEKRDRFTGYIENKEVSYVLADSDDLTVIGMTGKVVSGTDTKAKVAAFDIGVNDVIQIVLNANEEIISYRHIMKYDATEGYIAMVASTGNEDSDTTQTATLKVLSTGATSTHNAAVAYNQVYGYAVAGKADVISNRGIELFKDATITTNLAALRATSNIIDAAYNPNNIVYAYGSNYSKVKTSVFDGVRTFDTVNTSDDIKGINNIATDMKKVDDVIYLYSFDGSNILGFIIDVKSDN